MLGPSSGRSTGAAEHGPETPPYATSEYPGSDEYGSGYWYDDEYGDPNDDPYGYDDYEAYGQYEPETTETDNNAAEVEDQPEGQANDDAVSDVTGEYGYDREGFDEYSYDEYDDEYGYDEYERYDYEADYWQDDQVTANTADSQETADQADESADSTDAANADDDTKGYDDYEYDEYGYDEYGYEYDGYGYYDEYEEYGDGSPQSTSTDVPEEPAEDEVSDAETHQEADVVDQYGYWGEPIETPEEELPLPPGPQEVTDLSKAPAEVADAQDESEPAQPESELQSKDEYGYDGYYDEYGYEDEYGYYDEYGYDEYEQYNYGEEYGKYSRDFDVEDNAAPQDEAGETSEADDSLADPQAETYEDAGYYDAYESYYDYDYEYGKYGDEYPYGTGAESANDADQYDYDYGDEYGDEYGDNYGDEYGDEYDYDYDYDYCEYDYGDAVESKTAEPSYDTTSTERGWYMDDLDPFTWLPRDLLRTPDKELLRTLNVLYEEPGDVREAVLNEYIEGLGLDAVEFVARFEEAFGHQSLILEDDLPGVAALLATYRMVEQGELSMDEGVRMLEQHFNHLSQEWIEDVSLIVTELPPRTVRSERASSESDVEVLEALLTASTHSVRNFGLRLISALGDVSIVPDRFAAIGIDSDWTGQGTATVRDWIAR